MTYYTMVDAGKLRNYLAETYGQVRCGTRTVSSLPEES